MRSCSNRLCQVVSGEMLLHKLPSTGQLQPAQEPEHALQAAAWWQMLFQWFGRHGVARPSVLTLHGKPSGIFNCCMGAACAAVAQGVMSCLLTSLQG